MNGKQKQNERAVIIIAAIGFIFACTALTHEVMETVAQKENGVWEASREAETGNEQKGTLRIAENMTEENGGSPALIHKDGAAEETARAAANKITKQPAGEAGKETAKQPAGETVKETVRETRLPSGAVVRPFGWLEEGGIWRYHTGIDVRMEAGVRVGAAAGGTVRRAERIAGGWLVKVDSAGRSWQYEPLAELCVTVGKKIRLGEELGRLADGTSELHIGCQRGEEWTDPRRLVQ